VGPQALGVHGGKPCETLCYLGGVETLMKRIIENIILALLVPALLAALAVAWALASLEKL